DSTMGLEKASTRLRDSAEHNLEGRIEQPHHRFTRQLPNTIVYATRDQPVELQVEPDEGFRIIEGGFRCSQIRIQCSNVRIQQMMGGQRRSLRLDNHRSLPELLERHLVQ